MDTSTLIQKHVYDSPHTFLLPVVYPVQKTVSLCRAAVGMWTVLFVYVNSYSVWKEHDPLGLQNLLKRCNKQSWQPVDRKSPALASGLLVLLVAQVTLLLAV